MPLVQPSWPVICNLPKNSGSSIYEYLIDTYEQHGCYFEELISITKKGKEGAQEIASPPYH